LEENHFAFVSTGRVEQMRHGEAPYVDRSEALGLARSGWAWESRLADLNNDGVVEALQANGFLQGTHNRWPELHEIAMGNDALLALPGAWHHFGRGDDLSGHDRNALFARAADGRYYDVAAAAGLADAQMSRGIATADVDGDGDLDLAVANQWRPSQYYRNDSPGPGRFLGLRLLLPVDAHDATTVHTLAGRTAPPMPVRPAIGAQAMIPLPDGRRLVAHVDGGNGHSGVRSPELHFGLGDWPGQQPVQVELKWRGAGGRIHLDHLQLAPGWHTVVLGASDDRTPSKN
jgi:hypothetical protein